MLALDRITEVAQEIARAKFGVKRVEEVRVEPIADWTGRDSLDVLIVLQPKAAKQLGTTNKDPEMLHDLAERLGSMGELRFADVGYATRAELDASDEPEP